MKIIFMGSPDFAVPSLEALHRAGQEISLVVSNPDKRRTRNGEPEPTPVKQFALDHHIDVYDAEELKDPLFIDKIRSYNADLLVVVAFRILPPIVLQQARYGAVNLHASLLPKYRGAAPIHHAILNGESETGCTIFQLNEKMDAGKVIAQQRVPIGPNETTGDLYDRLSHVGAELLTEAVDQLEKGEASFQDQDDSLASPAPKVFVEDGLLDVRCPAQQVHNQARAMTPFPGAWITYNGHGREEKLKIHRTELPSLHTEMPADNSVLHTSVDQGAGEKLAPGELSYDAIQKQLLLGCGEQTYLILKEVQLPGKTRISGADFTKGNPLNSTL